MQAGLKELCDMNEQVEGGVSLTVSQYVILRFVKLEKNMTEQLRLGRLFSNCQEVFCWLFQTFQSAVTSTFEPPFCVHNKHFCSV